MDLGAHPRGPEPLLTAPPRDTVPSRFVGLSRRPYRVPCAGSQVPGWLSAAPARVVSTPTPEALLWPRSCWLSSHPRGGHDGWGGPGPCDRAQRPRAPPFLETHGEQVQVSADGNSRSCRSRGGGCGEPSEHHLHLWLPPATCRRGPPTSMVPLPR